MASIPTSYHGTDARIVRMTHQDRHLYKSQCLLALDYMWPLYEPYDIAGPKEKELLELLNYNEDQKQWSEIKTALRFIRSMKSGHSQYQYQEDSIYLTCEKNMAVGFAHRAFAGGEFGMMTYRLICTIPRIQHEGWRPNDNVSEAIAHISAFATEKLEPVIFEFKNLDIRKLVTDRDFPVQLHDEDLINRIEFHVVRYLEPIELDLTKAVSV